MTVIISGTDGVSDVDGDASTPALRGTDANTGIFFGADIIGFSEGGAECARFNADAQFVAAAGTVSLPVITTTGDVNTGIFFPAADTIAFAEGGAEAMRIDSSGRVMVGIGSSRPSGGFLQVSAQGQTGIVTFTTSTSNNNAAYFENGNGIVGTITTNASATAYNTSSDYRLKENIAPMTGALDTVAQLNPVTYNWKADGSAGEGFIAHELQEVVPDCVSGEKDAVDADGNPVYQGVDTSFLVATLTAAIQELKAINDAQAQTIESLTARVVALEAQ